MPRALVYIVAILMVLAMIPPCIVALARTNRTEKPRIHYFQDMDNQPRFKAQQPNAMFADGRSMRSPVAGSVARGELRADGHSARGVVNGAWARRFPAETPVTMEFMQRGRARFNIYCQPCHGLAGYGAGIVHQRAMKLTANPRLGKGTMWVAPKSLHDAAVREQPVGQIYNTITNGIRNMAGYGSQIPVDDRWAIVAYVKALQRSQHAEAGDVPAAQREQLEVIDLTEGEADEP